MYSPAQQGFGRIRTQGGAQLFGGLSGRSLEREAGLASGALAGKSALNRANAKAKAVEYQGRMEGRNAMFGGLLSGLTSLGTAAAKTGMFGGGVDFSSTDAQAMGMPSGQANYMSKGGNVYWDSDMGLNQWQPMGFGRGFGGF
jgi:hypothetical protein|tara:strand:- start:150 stop:578 length:429 start_codon:yes stop_codon:yes gene_type:complete